MPTPIKAPLAKPVREAKVQPRTISIRTRVFRVYVILAAIVLAILAGIAHVVPYFPWDLEITRLVQSWTWLGGILTWASWPGFFPQLLVIIVIIIAGLAITGLYWEAVTAIISFSVTDLVVNLLKHWVGRIRPLATLVNVNQTLSGGSFPSGHVVDYVVVLGFLWFLAFTSFKKSIWRRLIMLISAIMIILIGPSRIYLGEHWPSDVAGAYLLGSMLLWSVIKLYRFGKDRHLLKSVI